MSRLSQQKCGSSHVRRQSKRTRCSITAVGRTKAGINFRFRLNFDENSMPTKLFRPTVIWNPNDEMNCKSNDEMSPGHCYSRSSCAPEIVRWTHSALQFYFLFMCSPRARPLTATSSESSRLYSTRATSHSTITL